MQQKARRGAAILGVVLAFIGMLGIWLIGRHWYFEVAGFVGIALVMVVAVINMNIGRQ